MESGDDVVISGISGRLPESGNVADFLDLLFDGVDMLTVDDRRYPPGIWGTPKRCGKIPEVDRFDAGFFGIHPKLANFMDPRHKILLETVYECIVDAGYNPRELRGSKTGVYVGLAAFSNPEELKRHETQGYTNLGFSLALAANRVSYTFDLRGPSYIVDTACSSSMYAFSNALRDIRDGETEAALVNGAHLIVHPHETMEFNNLNMLAGDGKCKVFSSSRDGYARSEAVVSLLLQKRSKARRVYATVLGAKLNADGYKPNGITLPSAVVQAQLMGELYSSIGVDPGDVVYVEAHGTGTPAGDIEECQGLSDVFCKNRKTPLPIGSVKSNMGHAEMASGLCSVLKVIGMMERGVIPANLHVDPLDTTLPGISDGRLKVVTEPEPFDGGVVAVNSFGFGGANAHLAMRSHPKSKRTPGTNPKHRLVLVSGRTEDSVDVLLDGIRTHRDDPEFLALVDEVHKMNVDGHLYRGYEVLGDDPVREVKRYSKDRPVWFVYAGMGSQWIGMGRDLMRVKTFRETFERCAETLRPYGLDLVDVVTTDSPDVFKDITNCFAAIGAVAIALTDVLFSLGIRPDGMVGHSLGEVFCAYADGAVTAEEAILLAYARAHACVNTEMPPGRMAAVGLSKSAVERILPEDVFVACENGAESVTVSGPKASTEAFVEELNSKGIFARRVESADIAFHTKYIMEAGRHLQDFVRGVLKTERPRTSRWVSSSVPKEMVDVEWTKRNSSEYHRNNFCNPVLFRQALGEIPVDAVVVEVAPHGLLQAILKRELGPDVTCVSVANRNSEDNERFMLSAVGKIFAAGRHPQVRSLYPVDFPVGAGTAPLSPLVRWDHSTRWLCHLYRHQDRFGAAVAVDLRRPGYSHLVGHVVDGRVLMPATGYLEIAWKVLAGLLLRDIERLAVVFEDVKFRRATVLPDDGAVEFLVNITRSSGYFEISEGGSVVVTGKVRTPKDVSVEFVEATPPVVPRDRYLLMQTDDVYKEAGLRKYRYGGVFVGLKECDVHGLRGRLAWNGKFDAFIDTMMHLGIVRETSRDLMVPIAVRRIVVDPELHLRLVAVGGPDGLDVFYNQKVNTIRSGGVEIDGLEFSKMPQRHQVATEPQVATYRFVPYETDALTEDQALRTALQVVLQNVPGQIKRLRVYGARELSDKVHGVLRSEPMVEFDTVNEIESSDLVIVPDGVEIPGDVPPDVYVLRLGTEPQVPDRFCTVFRSGVVRLLKVLGDDVHSAPGRRYRVVHVRSTDFDWLEMVKVYSGSEDERIVFLYAQDDELNGLMGLVKCLRTEGKNVDFRAVVVEGAPGGFSLEDEFYWGQLRKGLAYNVFREGTWGTYAHVPIDEEEGTRESEWATVTIGTLGDLSTLGWKESPQRSDDPDLVDVHYSALNFKDIMVATGRISFPGSPTDPTVPEVQIGLEFSGVTSTGKRTMGMLGHGAIGLRVTSDPEFTWEVPAGWSLEDAATVPCVYATCYYALFLRGRIESGDSILIHAGTGGIGMAAITVALAVGCRVYVTVGSNEKREYLRKMFPSIPPEDIGDSRSPSFERTVLERTSGRGVDYVLNSLSEELFQASLRCVARRGTFLEIGKFDMMNSTPIDSKLFMKNCSFHGVLLDDFFDEDSTTKSKIRDLLDEGIKSGVVRPLPRTVFEAERLEEAFRYLSSGRHKGKVLIRLGRDPTETIPRSIPATPTLHFDPKKSYVVVGGLGGFGLELADWMIRRGATRLLLNSRRDPSNGYQSYCLKKWSQFEDVVVEVCTDDTTHLVGAERVVSRARDLGGPVGGIFSLGMVLRDELVANQTKASFEEVFGPKIVSARNLDAVTRRSCPHLEHFVAFSSIASGRGNRGQGNYAMANSAMERLCEKRRGEGLPALAVQWGAIGDVGVLTKVATNPLIFNYLKLQPVRSCLECLERFMLRRDPVVSSHVLADVDVASTTPASSRTPASAVAHILGLKSYDSVDGSTTLAQLGLDSLMLSEIKQTLYRNHQVDLGPDEIRELTFAKLIGMEAGVDGSVADESSPPRRDGSVNYIAQRDTVVRLRHVDSEHRDVVLFLVHSIEGTIEALEPLAEKLRASSIYGVQCSSMCRFETMEELAGIYVNEVKKVRPRGPYLLGGYSFGAAVAFEMALQLERLGDPVRLLLIEGSPEYVRTNLRRERQGSDDESVDAVLRAFAANFPEVTRDEVVAALGTSKDARGKIEALSRSISSKTEVGDDVVTTSIDGFLGRCKCGLGYEPAGRFEGEATLVRVRGDVVDVAEDYGLQKVCGRQVRVFKLDGNHRTILGGEFVQKVAGIINENFLGNKR